MTRGRKTTGTARSQGTTVSWDVERIAAIFEQYTHDDGFDWAAHTEAVAADIFGACNEQMSRPPEDVRFGNKGSVSINFTTGQWYDFEHKRGGGVKELIRVYKGIEDRDEAIAYAKQCLNGEKTGADDGADAHRQDPPKATPARTRTSSSANSRRRTLPRR